VQDPFRIDDYLANNIFLPDINNERVAKNATYADNLASLERLVLYRFEKEYTVVPRGRCTICAELRLICHVCGVCWQVH
jgi:Palmitoyl protein thioesterase